MGQEASLTILFTDVEGSTELRTNRGDTAAHSTLSQAVADYERMAMPRHRDITAALLGIP
jgi:class 3 adenylate cyclase